ncbi:MAG: threonylcarbamoyl-AMP synthase [Clostridia bacterium]|nr:threonylcarbamoyl-AMP synthase [Clostridia bacterium]MBR3274919.1 threonylcarbamoyl-AMP synthase [Clostridia bacterium]
MQTELLPVNDESLSRAGELIRAGGLVAFPTETVYGLGANALDADAVRRIFEAKGRPGDNPLIVHISRVDQLSPLITGAPSPAARALMDACWPGPMTLIFPKSPAVPAEVTAGLDTVAVRFPVHPAARSLIEAARRPIAAPSANRSGRPSPTTAAHVLEDMDGRVPLILDGGACAVGLESTVIDVTGDTPRILRPGGVTPERIAEICGGVTVDDAVLRPLREGERPRSPGMKYRHYAPTGALTIVQGGADAVAGKIRMLYDAALAGGKSPLILALDGHIDAYGDRRCLSLGADAEAMARSMFARLRDADALGADAIFSEAIPTDGMGLAVMNRLERAAGFNILEADG